MKILPQLLLPHWMMLSECQSRYAKLQFLQSQLNVINQRWVEDYNCFWNLKVSKWSLWHLICLLLLFQPSGSSKKTPGEKSRSPRRNQLQPGESFNLTTSSIAASQEDARTQYRPPDAMINVSFDKVKVETDYEDVVKKEDIEPDS